MIRYYRSVEGVLEADNFDFMMNQILFKSIFSDDRPTTKRKMELLESFKSVTTLKELFSGEFSGSLLDIPFTVIFMLIIASLSPAMALLLLGVVITYLMVVFFCLTPFSIEASEKQMVSEQNLTNYLLETFSKLLTVKSYHSEERSLRKAEFLIDTTIFKSFRSSMVKLLSDSYNEVNSQILFYGAIALGAYLVTEGKLTIGELTACSFMTKRIFQPIQSLASIFIKYRRYELAIERIVETLPDQEIEDENIVHQDYQKNLFLGEIEINNLTLPQLVQQSIDSFHFKAKKTVLIQSNDKLLTSQIARAISHPKEKALGTVLIDGISGENLSVEILNDLIGHVSLANSVFSGKVIDNITVFNGQKTTVAQDVITMLGRNSLINELPNGLDTQIDSKNVTFYPGLKETINFARQLIKNPRVLILERVDEVMDKSDLNSLLWLLRMLHGKLTIILFSKNLVLSKVADEVVQIEQSLNRHPIQSETSLL